MESVTHNAMAAFALFLGGFNTDPHNVRATVGGVGAVTVNAGGGLFGACLLPTGQQRVKMVFKSLRLPDVTVAFQAIFIGDGVGQRRGLGVVSADERQRVAHTQFERVDSAGFSFSAVALNAVHAFGSVRRGEVGGRLGGTLNEGGFGVGVATGAKAVVVFQMDAQCERAAGKYHQQQCCCDEPFYPTR